MYKLPFFVLAVKELKRPEKRQFCLFRGKSEGSSAFSVALMVDHCLSGTSHLKRRLIFCQGRFLSGFKLEKSAYYFFSKSVFVVSLLSQDQGLKCNMLFDTLVFSLKTPNWISQAASLLSAKVTRANPRHLSLLPLVITPNKVLTSRWSEAHWAMHIQSWGTKARHYVSLQSEHCVHWALKWEASVKEQKRISCEGTTSVSSALCSLRSIHYLHLFRSYTKPCPLALWVDSGKGWVVVAAAVTEEGCQKKNKTSPSRTYIQTAIKKRKCFVP